MRQATTKDHRQSIRAELNEARKQLGIGALDFPEWLASVTPNWTWDWPHQRYLYSKLDLVTRGKCKRLMIFMPPRHTKTETVTVRYSAYRLERNPKMNIILGCYNQKIANKFSRKTLRICKQRMKLSSDRKAVEEWETLMGGGFRAVGVGGGITGSGGDLIMLDDPVKSREEAESEAYRERVWDWFNDDLYSRLEPGAAIILTMTRWHDDDLAGRLIKEMKDGGEHWDIASLPAIAEEPEKGTLRDRDPIGRKPGQALCPQRYDIDDLRRIEKKQGSYSFAALYQQRPTPREGALFKRDWFGADKIIDAGRVPANLRWNRGYDLAISKKTTADYTASFSTAFDKQGNLYIRDGFRKRIEYPEQKRYVLQRMQNEERTAHGIEKALHGEALVQDLRREPIARRHPLKAIKVDTDKFTRALAWASLAEEGKVFLVRGPWIDTFLAELLIFTGNGDSHDDQVDAVSIGVAMGSKKSGKLHAF